MTQPIIRSGWWESPSGFPLTPLGKSKRSEMNNPYITKAEYIETPEAIGMGITATSADGLYASGQLDKIILRASGFINRFCGRYFDTQTIDEYQTGFTVKPFNPRLVTVKTRNSPIQTLSGIWIQVLQWFIEVQTTPLESSYLQIQPDWGTFKIVPLLSTAGAGTGSPIPAAILDKVPLGVLWYTYTFGFGQAITSYQLAEVTSGSVYQVADYNYQLWAPDQTINIYLDGTIVNSSLYTLDCANGKVSFTASIGSGHSITADFITNNTIPGDVKQAAILLITRYVGAIQNPLKFKSMGITGYNVSYGDHDEQMKEIKELLIPNKKNMFTII